MGFAVPSRCALCHKGGNEDNVCLQFLFLGLYMQMRDNLSGGTFEWPTLFHGAGE